MSEGLVFEFWCWQHSCQKLFSEVWYQLYCAVQITWHFEFTNLSLLITCWWSFQRGIWFSIKVAILFFMSCLLRIYFQSLVFFFLNSWVDSIQYSIYWRCKILWRNSGNHSAMYIRFHVALRVHVFRVLSRKRRWQQFPFTWWRMFECIFMTGWWQQWHPLFQSLWRELWVETLDVVSV